MRKPVLYYFFIPFIFISCTKEVNIQLPAHEEKLVINSLFSPDTFFRVHISRSQLITDTSFLLETDPLVVLKYSHESDTLQRAGEGYFTLPNLIPRVQTRYNIEVFSAKYGNVTASDMIPEEVPCEVIDFKQKAGIDEDGLRFSSITIELSDSPDVKNYYEVMLFSQQNDSHNYCFIGLWSKDIIIKNEGNVNELYGGLIFSDNLINGETHSLLFNFYNGQDDLNTASKLFMHFRAVSKNYYLYKKKLVLHLDNQYGDIWDGTGDPVNLYSNVNNGYGIFAGYSEDIDTVLVSEWTGK